MFTIPPKTAYPLVIRGSGLSHLGIYDGSVRIRAQDSVGAETVRAIQFVRQTSGIDLSLSGQDIANGVLTLKPKSSDDKTFSFLVENAKTAGDAELTIKVTAAFGGRSQPTAVSVSPDNLKLPPGGSASVQLNLCPGPVPSGTPTDKVRFETFLEQIFRIVTAHGACDLPSSGDYQARISLIDKSGASKHLELKLQPTFLTWSDWSLIWLIVFVGALLSAVVGSAIPNLVARAKLWHRGAVLRDGLSIVPPADHYAKGLLAREIQRVDEQVHQADWYTPSAAQRLDEQGKKTGELEERLLMLNEVVTAREVARASMAIPTSERSRLSRELDEAAAYVAKAETSIARQKLEEVTKSVNAAKTSTDIKTGLDRAVKGLRQVALKYAPGALTAHSRQAAVEDAKRAEEQLKAQLSTQQPGEPQVTPAPTSQLQLRPDKTMVTRLTNLLVAYERLLDSTPREELLDLDYQAQCAHLYFKRYIDGVLLDNSDRPDFVAAQADVVSALSRGKSEFIAALELIESLEAGVTPSMFRTAIADLKSSAEIQVSPASPRGAELVTFRLIFRDDALNRSPLLRGLSVRWTFSAGASEGSGPRVGQHFRTSRKPQRIVCTVSVGPDEKQRITKDDLEIPGHPRLGGFVTQAEAVSWSITLVLAMLLAVISKQADMRPLDSMTDYINPFLWGFGLDRMKALVGSRDK